MLPKTIQSYEGPRADQGVVKNPQTQVSASSFNSLCEDAAQMTRTALRAFVAFQTRTSSGTVTLMLHDTPWGSGMAQAPTLTRVSAGIYTATYAISYLDGLSQSETVNFRYAVPLGVQSATFGHVQAAVTAGNVITIYVFDGANAASDLGGGVTIAAGAR